MQCPSCQFQNMPGTVVCGRCGAQLNLVRAEINVHPPRASAWARQFRRIVPFYRIGYRLRDGFAAALTALMPDMRDVPVRYGTFPRMIVPGWPQIYVGQIVRGRVMLAAYCALLLLGLLFVGTQPGGMLLGTALAVHAASVIDVVWGASAQWHARLVVAGICLAVLGTVVYTPVIWTVTRFVQVRRILVTAGPLFAGDVVLVSPRDYSRREPALGDVVLYVIPTRDIPTRAPGGGAAYYRVHGEFIDRVVAGPGQSVRWEHRNLWVDEQPSRWQPLNPSAVSVDLKFTVPAGYYCIFPSTQPAIAPNYPAEVWQQMSLISRDNMRASVELRTQPLWRWGTID